MDKRNQVSGYTDDSIRVLEGLEAVRKRPGMYIGSTDSKGLHHLIWEILDNSVDEVLAGHATEVTLTVKPDHVISVQDNGRGIPTGINPDTNTSNLVVVFTVLHAGGKFDNNSYKTSGGLHGVGSTCVNALSSWLNVRVFRNGEEYRASFRDGGKIDEEPRMVGNVDPSITGTTVTWKPDFTIFEESEYDLELIERRLHQLAYLNRSKKFIFVNEMTGVRKEFFFEEGIKDWVRHLNTNRNVIGEIVTLEANGQVKNRRNPQELNSISVSCAFQYCLEDECLVHSFCNNINTEFGGSHLESFKEGVLACVREWAVEEKKIKNPEEFEKTDILPGLTAIVSLGYSHPEYSGQTKGVLSNVEIKKYIREKVKEDFWRFMEENVDARKAILEKVESTMRLRLRIEMTKKADRKLVMEGFLSFAGKLADCTIKDRECSELYVVEGDSAGGSAKSARDRNYQAILPIKGKLMNVWKRSDMSKVVDNEEIKSIISAVGCSYANKFDIEKLNYNKVIIMTDADVDGSHIRILLLTFMFKYMRPLIEGGRVYIAQPPLYRVSTAKDSWYFFDDAERDEFLKKHENRKMDVSRFKGLGEMSPQQLWETTMSPEQRTLCRVNIEDEADVERAFDDLMGNRVEPRKVFISANYLNIRNLDI